MTLDEFELAVCTCAAAGSGEDHEDWCIYLVVEPEIRRLRKALDDCVHYAYRMQHDAFPLRDRGKLNAIVRLAEAALYEQQ